MLSELSPATVQDGGTINCVRRELGQHHHLLSAVADSRHPAADIGSNLDRMVRKIIFQRNPIGAALEGRSIAAVVWLTIRLPLSRIEANDAGRADMFCPPTVSRFVPKSEASAYDSSRLPRH